MIATMLGKLPASAIVMLVVTSVVLYGGIIVCLVLARKREP
ncbi:MAG: MetS family NSS transporter small subunit [Candidatus Eisenbacteria bacterium]